MAALIDARRAGRECLVGYTLLVLMSSVQIAPSIARANGDLAMTAAASLTSSKTDVRHRSSAASSVRHDLQDRALTFAPFLTEASRVYQLPVRLLWAVARVESAFNDRARSGVGACGLMQMMPRTAKSMGVARIYDPRQNILGGARYLRVLLNRWRGDLVLSLASYNAGPYAVERHLRRRTCVRVLGSCVPPYRETMRYVQRVLAFYRGYQE
jgi:soluble lytic murein transglycosylase-like protein